MASGKRGRNAQRRKRNTRGQFVPGSPVVFLYSDSDSDGNPATATPPSMKSIGKAGTGAVSGAKRASCTANMAPMSGVKRGKSVYKTAGASGVKRAYSTANKKAPVSVDKRGKSVVPSNAALEEHSSTSSYGFVSDSDDSSIDEELWIKEEAKSKIKRAVARAFDEMFEKMKQQKQKKPKK